MAARQGLACGQGLAQARSAPDRAASGPTRACVPGVLGADAVGSRQVSGPAVSGLALLGARPSRGWQPTVAGARRNHPAGGATPGQELSSSTDSPTACPSAALRRGVVGLRLARARNHQARRHGPGGHQIFRVIPAEQACTLPLFLRRRTVIRFPLDWSLSVLITDPSPGTFLAKCPSVPILALSRPYGMARGLMLPIESECVQRAIFRGMPDPCRDPSRRYARHRDLRQGLAC